MWRKLGIAILVALLFVCSWLFLSYQNARPRFVEGKWLNVVQASCNSGTVMILLYNAGDTLDVSSDLVVTKVTLIDGIGDYKGGIFNYTVVPTGEVVQYSDICTSEEELCSYAFSKWVKPTVWTHVIRCDQDNSTRQPHERETET